VAEAVEAAIDAFEVAAIQHGVLEATGPDDVCLPILVDDRPFTVAVFVVAYCTGDQARRLLAATDRPVGVVPMVVAERITAEARGLLTDEAWSWLDRRGRLHLRAAGVRVDIDVPAGTAGASKAAASPIRGRGGLAAAYWLCAHPGERLSPTGHAPVLGLAPSTISVASNRLTDGGLVDLGAGVFPELFWELAGAWRLERTWLVSAPDPAEHRDPDPDAATWRRTGSAAAAAYGAPVVTAGGGPVDLLVPGPAAVTIAVRRHGRTEPGAGAAMVAPAPVLAAVQPDPTAKEVVVDGWPAAPVLAVALELAQDRARGREILGDWHIDDAVWH